MVGPSGVCTAAVVLWTPSVPAPLDNHEPPVFNWLILNAVQPMLKTPVTFFARACLAWMACVCGHAQTSATEVVLHNFGGVSPNGSDPYAGLMIDPAGNFYGTTVHGGVAGQGVVFKLSPTGQQTVLYSFTGGNDGGQPNAGVVKDSAGNFYGTTYAGGAAGVGVVYKLDPSGRETVLYSFQDGTDGDHPLTGVVLDAVGNLYGATQYATEYYGVIYKVDTGGNYTVLHAFTNGADGGTPQGVTLDSAGNLYGAAARGGSNNVGVVFKLNPAGNETVLYNLHDGLQ